MWTKTDEARSKISGKIKWKRGDKVVAHKDCINENCSSFHKGEPGTILKVETDKDRYLSTSGVLITVRVAGGRIHVTDAWWWDKAK